jgi:hypothetical protein
VAPASPDPLASLDTAYIKQVTRHLTSIGSSPLGFRVFGTPQDKEAANYLAGQMTSLGLENVGVEQVPGDGWLLEGASVEIDAPGARRTFQAASFGGAPGTSPGGVSGEFVFAGGGPKSGFDAADVAGKIAFVRWNYRRTYIWLNQIAMEGAAHGAEAVVLAPVSHGGYYTAGGGRALGSFDSSGCPTLCAPMVSISRLDGKWLRSALQEGSLQGKVVLDAENLTGSTGYQAIGQITGSVHPDQVIVFTAHQDAWFTGAADDTVGVAMVLAIARAVKESGYQPEYTWVFAPVTGEEYGLADSYYDWLRGAFWRITQSHTDWASSAVAVLNWELHSPPYHLQAGVPRELRPFVDASFSQSRADGLVPDYSLWQVNAGDDAWTYSAEGAPAISFYAQTGSYNDRYHTDFDSIDSLDFPGLLPYLTAETRVALELDASLVPWSFTDRLSKLREHLGYRMMGSHGIDTSVVRSAYRGLDEAWRTAAAAPPSVCVATHVRQATRISLDRFTALSAYDNTVYPHWQAQRDIRKIEAAISALRAGRVDQGASNVGSVGFGYYIHMLSETSYEQDLLLRTPAYPEIGFGAQGQLAPLPNLWSLWWGLHTGGTGAADALAELEPLLASETSVYQARVASLVETMNDVAAELNAAAAC